MKDVIYISAQPDELYFAWQVEVMIDNFIEMSIPKNNIHIVIGIHKHVGEYWFRLIEKYKEVGFYFYEDTRESKKYFPSIRPHILYKHWERLPWLQRSIVFYHDCDILFTRTPNFSKLLDDNIWYMSDVKSYIGVDYIKSNGINIFHDMCKLMNIQEDIVMLNDKNVGGAQYLMKNVISSFWRRVEDKSERLYEYFNASHSEIQKWTSDMWTVLWTAWFFHYSTKVTSQLSFSMATDTWPKWNKNLIYHNAGVVNEHRGKLFLKSDFRSELPYVVDNPYDKQFCSYKYFDQVIKTGKLSCLKNDPPDMEKLLSEVKSIFI
jgi:hypothetical protein